MRKFNMEHSLIKVTHSITNDINAGKVLTGGHLSWKHPTINRVKIFLLGVSHSDRCRTYCICFKVIDTACEYR
jgi:hypothetical protein